MKLFEKEINFKMSKRKDFNDLNNKCKNNLSDEGYNRLKVDLRLQLPSLENIKKLRKNLNSKFLVSNNKFGFYNNLKQKLKIILNENTVNDLKNIENKTIIIKFCGDGTNVGRRLNVFNFSFSIINQVSTCKTSLGHYCLGLHDIKENYENISSALKEVFSQVDEIEEIEINKEVNKIRKILACDLKSLSLINGINQAIQNTPVHFVQFVLI
jgi:hypothetical protein